MHENEESDVQVGNKRRTIWKEERLRVARLSGEDVADAMPITTQYLRKQPCPDSRI